MLGHTHTETPVASTKAERPAFNIMEGLDSPTTRMGFALVAKAQQDGGHIYEGTVPYATKARRRAANRVARRQRAVNRTR